MLIQLNRSNKERDPDQTRRALLDAAAEILKQKGYTSFTADQIAIRAGVDQRLIKHYFGSLNGLLKMLLHEKDFWLPVIANFERPHDLKAFLKEVLKQQVDYLWETRELQQFVLWQVSAHNEVISAVVKLRDEEGRKLLGLCKEQLYDTYEEFETTIALIVGGVTTMVLQSVTGNGPVCGVDLNNEADRRRLYNAIDKLIDRQWEAAVERREA